MSNRPGAPLITSATITSRTGWAAISPCCSSFFSTGAVPDEAFREFLVRVEVVVILNTVVNCRPARSRPRDIRVKFKVVSDACWCLIICKVRPGNQADFTATVLDFDTAITLEVNFD